MTDTASVSMAVTHVGLAAGALTTAAGFPQVLRAYRTKHTRDISIWQPVLLVVGMTLWLIYGILLGDIPLIVANAISIFCYSALIVMKIRYRDNEACDTPTRRKFKSQEES